MVRVERFELSQGCPHMDLNHARLPFRHTRKKHDSVPLDNITNFACCGAKAVSPRILK